MLVLRGAAFALVANGSLRRRRAELAGRARATGFERESHSKNFPDGARLALCGRLSVGKGFLRSAAIVGRCGRVFDLLTRCTRPLAIMPSAKAGPDRKHALEALGHSWVFPPSGFDRLSHYFMFALTNWVSVGSRFRCVYAASGSR